MMLRRAMAEACHCRSVAMPDCYVTGADSVFVPAAVGR
jgi:hypothetical protein